MMKSLVASLSLLFVMAIGVAGCGEVEEAYNCAQVCEAYDDCAEEFGADIDELNCFDECEAAGDQEDEQEFQSQLRECGQCLEVGESCTESIPCADECAAVAPEIIAQ